MHVEIQIHKYSETTVICISYFTHLNVHLADSINFNYFGLQKSLIHEIIYIHLFKKMCKWSFTVFNVINRGNNTLMIQY